MGQDHPRHGNVRGHCRNLKILLLGPNGQLGSDITRAADGFDGLTILPCPRSALEVTNIDAIAGVLESSGADVVLNTTSYHLTDEVEDNADKAVAINAHGVAALAKACFEQNKGFATISTDYVFGGENQQTPYRETDRPAPINVYGATKAMGEALALYHHPASLIFRVASLFGVTGPSGKGANFIEVMLKLARERDELRVVNDQIMCPTHTADAAQSILTALSKKAPGGVYHCVGTGQGSWFDLASEAIKQAGIDVKITPVPATEFPTRATRPGYTVLDNSKLAAICGPIPHWRDGVQRYLAAKGHL